MFCKTIYIFYELSTFSFNTHIEIYNNRKILLIPNNTNAQNMVINNWPILGILLWAISGMTEYH